MPARFVVRDACRHESSASSRRTGVTGGGGLTKTGINPLILVAPVYAGDTTVNAGNLQVNAANANNDESSVFISSSGKMILNFTGTDTVQRLYSNGSRIPNGVYSRSSANATTLGITSYFGTTGNGSLTVSDTVVPTLSASDIVDDQGGAPVVLNTPVTYTVTFSEEMDASTISAADFGNAGTSTVNIGTVTQISAAVFQVPLTPTSPGTLQLRVNAGADLRDFVNNPLNTASAIADNTIITVNSASQGYQIWSGGASASGDANNDGVKNAVAYALGASDVNQNAIALLPSLDNTSDPNFVIFTYNRSDAAQADATADIGVEYGSDLAGWTTATHNGSTVLINITDSSPNDTMVVKIARSLAAGNKLFVRLKVKVAP